MNTILKSSIIAATLTLGAATFLSATPASAGGFSFGSGMDFISNAGGLNFGGGADDFLKRHWHPPVMPHLPDMPRQDRNDDGPSYGGISGGVTILIDPRLPKGEPVFKHGKNNCNYIERQIASSEKRLAHLNALLDQMRESYKGKEAKGDKLDTYYTSDSMVHLLDEIETLEGVIAKLHVKLKECETRPWA